MDADHVSVFVPLYLDEAAAKSLAANCQANGMSASQVFNHFLLHYQARDPETAFEYVMEEIGMTISALGKQDLIQFLVELVGVLGEMLIAAEVAPAEVQEIMNRLGYIE